VREGSPDGGIEDDHHLAQRIGEGQLGRTAKGKYGERFYAPSSVVRVHVEVLAPNRSRIYDPWCGSDGMFVQSEQFIEAHAGKLGETSVYGQESNCRTLRLPKMILAICGIVAQIVHDDTFTTTGTPTSE
jgi:type I restriction enzyme M protein